jgi:hypothetical protein
MGKNTPRFKISNFLELVFKNIQNIQKFIDLANISQKITIFVELINSSNSSCNGRCWYGGREGGGVGAKFFLLDIIISCTANNCTS